MSKGDKSQNIFYYKVETLDYWKQTIEILQLSIEFDLKVNIAKIVSLFNSFQMLLNGSQKIFYFTIMLSPAELIKANSDQFSFCLKLRKYIKTNLSMKEKLKLNHQPFVQPLDYFQIKRLLLFLNQCIILQIVLLEIELENKLMNYQMIKFLKQVNYYYQNLYQLQQQPQQIIATFSPQQQKDEEISQKQTVQTIQQQQKQSKQNDLQSKMQEVDLIHGNQVSNYNKLTIFTQQTQAKLSKVLTQIKQGQQLDESEIQDNGIYEFF
ncbi:unnamed protein product [Paramecium pentaurelia]|uniref:Uncharacterized protein n=1 Tax=Paramecium pentaurelia TaxID=43138 RepID=A0A8S1V2M9_9CILI|nr:unnamed protein product [Paramecium pentaurelia]